MTTDDPESSSKSKRTPSATRQYGLGVTAAVLGTGVGIVAREWFLILLFACWIALMIAFFSARPIARAVCAGIGAGLIVAMAATFFRIGI